MGFWAKARFCLVLLGLVGVARPASAEEFDLQISVKLIRSVESGRLMALDAPFKAKLSLLGAGDVIVSHEDIEGENGLASTEFKLARLQSPTTAFRELVLEIQVEHPAVPDDSSKQAVHIRLPSYVTASRIEVPVYFFAGSAVDDQIYRLNAIREGVRADWARFFILEDLFELKYASGSKKAAAVAAWYLFLACVRLASTYDETALYFNFAGNSHCTADLDRLIALAKTGDEYGYHLAKIFRWDCTWATCGGRLANNEKHEMLVAYAAFGKLYGYAARNLQNEAGKAESRTGMCNILRYFRKYFLTFKQIDDGYMQAVPGSKGQIPPTAVEIDDYLARCPQVGPA